MLGKYAFHRWQTILPPAEKKNSCGSRAYTVHQFQTTAPLVTSQKISSYRTVTITAEMYNLSAIRYIIQQIVQITPCGIPKCFIPLEAPLTYLCMAFTTTAVLCCYCGRQGTLFTLVSSFRAFTRLDFLPCCYGPILIKQ